MPEAERQFQKRQIAHKVVISDILNCDFIKDDISAGYIKLNNVNISRVNIISTIVDKSGRTGYSGAVIDDGTGRILLKSFENTDVFSILNIGDVVLIVGRIREFNNERYIVPEILKKLDNTLWMAARKIELKTREYGNESQKENTKTADYVGEEAVNDDVYSLIKKLDIGDGASVEDILSKFNGNEAENIINRLLKNGNIFEVRPGKLKVLE